MVVRCRTLELRIARFENTPYPRVILSAVEGPLHSAQTRERHYYLKFLSIILILGSRRFNDATAQSWKSGASSAA